MTPEELYQRYVRLIHHVAHKVKRTYHFTEEDAEDIASAITLKVIAVPPAKAEHKLGEGYVRMVINNTARDEIRRIKKERQIKLYGDFAFPDEESVDGEKQIEFEDARQNTALQQMNQDTLSHYLSILNKYERSIVDMLLGSADREPMNMRQIAKALKVTAPAIQQTLNRTYFRMKKTHA